MISRVKTIVFIELLTLFTVFPLLFLWIACAFINLEWFSLNPFDWLPVERAFLTAWVVFSALAALSLISVAESKLENSK